MDIRSIPPGQPMAAIAARHVLATLGERLPEAVLLLPTRRACNLMRMALLEAAGGANLLLPRILPLGDLEPELPALLPSAYLERLAAIPPAMAPWRRLGLLMRQVSAFERGRQGGITTAHTLGLARDLAGLQDNCHRQGAPLTMERLRTLDIPAHYAAHWESSLAFLGIVAETWPAIEAEEGAITQSARQWQLLTLLAEAWEAEPPAMPVIAIGSTGSQPVTARLLHAVARAPQGGIVLPGFDAPERWAAITPGHPLHHIRQLLDGWGVAPHSVARLGKEAAPSIWLDALAAPAELAQWRMRTLPPHAHIRLLPCAHGEEEARILALLIREGVEEGKRTALITPDEGLMQRVSAHLARYGIAPGRLKQGSLGTTESGSLWLAALRFIADPARALPALALLRHPLLLPAWEGWLAQAEPYFRGLARHRPGQLPAMPPELRDRPEYAAAAALLRGLAALHRRQLAASEWLEHVRSLLPAGGEGAEQLAEALEALSAADILGPLDGDGFTVLLAEALSDPWRGGIHESHPLITMLTPLEARLQQFDRVLLANMQDAVWPGLARPGAWLNAAQLQALGLPSPEEQASLMAHDILTLGSQSELFLTYPSREQGSPVTRSRFIERLVALLAVHGIAESALHVPHYHDWAAALYRAERYAPAAQPMPRPVATRRPAAMAASALEHLASDPYWLYARYVLGLSPLDPADAEPEARELGTIVHAAIRRLTEHWNEHNAPADAAQRASIADTALAPYATRPEARLFWRQRLERALAFVNALEGQRRIATPQVTPEHPLERKLELGDAILTLYGRIDRLEAGEGGLRIGDYKTGKAPTGRDMLNGNAMQLLAYAMMMELAGRRVAGLDYWELPAGRRGGTLQGLEGDALAEAGLTAQLHQMLEQFMHPETPLLARPHAAGERYENPYDGISRYDEWAG